MHETARRFGYPSESTRAARERAREATCGHCLHRSGPVRPPPLPELRCVAPRPCGSSLRCDASRPCGSTLAGVGHCPLAIGHGCLVGLLAGVLDRRPVSPLPSSPACSGAGSGWHRRTQIADSTVYLGGPATGGAGPLLCADSWAAWAATVWRIASAARLRRFSRMHDHDRLTRAVSPSRPVPIIPCGRCKQPALKTLHRVYRSSSCIRSAVTLLVCALDPLVIFSPVIIVPC